jgi:REP element-mobilizing transposase RayT
VGLQNLKPLTLHQVLEFFSMPKGLRRWYGGGDLHYITCSCYQRKPFLGSASRRDLFLKIFEEVRQKYEFQVVGYVVMPEHIHLLIGEPDDGSIAVIMQVLKQRVSHQCLSRARSRLAQNTAPPVCLILRQGARIGMLGLVIGSIAAYLSTRALSSMLYGVNPHDPLIFATIAVSLFVVVVLASYVPARRATRVDPLIALRYG